MASRESNRASVGLKVHDDRRKENRALAERPLRGKLKIVSGGQTGADRAALDVALKLKIPHGGWCPADRRAEDGVIPRKYHLLPLPGAGYRQRTRRNVQDSDGTVIFSFGPLTGGSRATAGDCARCGRPVLVIDASLCSTSDAALQTAVFLLRYRIDILNVAGPRASGQPEIYDYVCTVLQQLLAPVKKPGKRSAQIQSGKL